MQIGERVTDKEPTSIDLNELYTKFKPIISYKVRKSLGTYNPDWEDVVNEILTNVIEKIKKGEFRGESAIGTFIYTITHRRIIDYIRKKSKVLRHIPEPDPFPDPVNNVEQKEKAERIAASIKKLKPKYREVLYLYYYKDLTRQEVAEQLGVPPRRVSELVNYSHKLLKKVLKMS